MISDRKTIDCGERSFNLGGTVVDRKWLQAQLRQISQANNLKGVGTVAYQWLIISTAIFLALGTLHYLSGSFNLLESFSKLSAGQIAIVVLVYFSQHLSSLLAKMLFQ
ncbi:MAG: hypothetical protein HC820_06375 [Hydrococcus sp. RM1_1_31]|nr:hypothetical protein [Hydrococcus sp. RM1_1_31]